MTSVPEAITNYRAVLNARAEQARLDGEFIAAEIAAVDMCIAAIEDAAESSGAEDVDGITGVAARVAAPEAENALAGSVEPAAKKPRAPKRDIRGLVLGYVEARPIPPTLYQLTVGLGFPLRVVEKAVAHWQSKGRLTLEGGAVRLRDDGAAGKIMEGMQDALAHARGDEAAARITRVGDPVEPQQIEAAE